MKRIFGISCMIALIATGLRAQNNDNTVMGNSDDTYYNNDDNNTNGNDIRGSQNYDNNNQVTYNKADDGPDNTPAPTEQTFHDQLSPYGNWVQSPSYGQVWVPTQVPAGFTPYATGGHWVNSQYGWTWVSDYAWGWAPFHYGRWFRDNVYGWAWVPGYDWASAWVAWGDYGDYYCWAPLLPGYAWPAYGNYRPPFYCWNFVPHACIGYGRLGAYLVDRGRLFNGGAVNIHRINEVGASRNLHFFAGPRAADVERYSGQHVNRVNVTSVHNLTSAHINNNVGHATQVNRNVNERQQQFNHNNAPAQQRATQRQNRQHQSMASQQNYNRSQQTQQHYAQSQSRPSQGNYSRSQPVQSNSNRSFASVQRSTSHYSSGGGTRSSGYSGGSHGGSSGGHGHSR